MAIYKINGITVRTTNEYPPIPLRQFDWSAIDDDTYDGAEDSHCPIGRGATEQKAIDDLLEQMAEALESRLEASKGGNVRGVTEDHRFEMADKLAAIRSALASPPDTAVSP